MDRTFNGLLRGLRYITNMFEQEKEPEMQIGPPTDVKHVAHIGGDGPAANKPHWMNEFSSDQEPSTSAKAPNTAEKEVEKPGAEDATEKPKHRSRRRSSSNGSDLSVTSPKDSDKPSRHNRNQSGGSVDNDASDQRRRRHRHSKQDAETPSQDQPPIPPKHTRRKKSGGSSPGGSQERNSLTDISDIM